MNDMKNSDLIYQMVKKYGKEEPDLSKQYGVSPDMKYIHLYDHPACGNVHIDMIAIDPHNSKKHSNEFTNDGRMFYRPFLVGDGGTQHHLRPLGDYKLDGRGTYNGEETLVSIINTLLIEKQIGFSNKKNGDYDVEFVELLLERYKEDLSRKRHYTFIDNSKVDENIRERIHTSIRKSIHDKFGGNLEFPTPLPLISPSRNIQENSIFLVATAIDHHLVFWAPNGSDSISDNRYGIEFLNSINDLVGGRDMFEFVRQYPSQVHEFWVKQSVPQKNGTKMTDLEALNLLIQTDGGIGLNYRPYTDYSYDKICKKDGEYILEYTIYKQKPVLHRKISDDMALEICKKSGLDLVKKVQERIDEGKEYDVKRFRKALQTLMPNLYEEVIEQGKADVKNLEELIQWKNTTEKTSNKIKELKERTPSGKLEDVPHLTTQVLRTIGEDNLGKSKRSKSEKKIIKSAIAKVLQSTR